MPAVNKRLFLSAVSTEFESYRALLAKDFRRDTLDVAVQEDFATGGGLTLAKLDDYIRGPIQTGSAPSTYGAQAARSCRNP